MGTVQAKSLLLLPITFWGFELTLANMHGGKIFTTPVITFWGLELTLANMPGKPN